MIYINIFFYIFLMLLLIVYYCVPIRYRWYALLVGSIGFYYLFSGGLRWLFAITVVISWIMGQVIYRYRNKGVLILSVVMVILPLLVTKHGGSFWRLFAGNGTLSLIAPLGISFYTLQIISYLVDIYRQKIEPQNNLLRYALYVSFFPQIVQGPIPRYEKLGTQLYTGHRFEERTFMKGVHLIIWGFFLKLMIADKAAVIVNAIYGNFRDYKGFYVLIAGILYSIQLYTDFQACVCIAKGAAGLFGIELEDNFRYPYASTSIKEFWQRWHISLSSWLRDYIYIPLGGNRKGRLRKYINISITFAVSGAWHGSGIKYVFWGMMHAVYQIMGEILEPITSKLYQLMRIQEGSFCWRAMKTAGTCFWVMIAWIVFRADGLLMGIRMIMNMVTSFNPWILFDDSLLALGLEWKEWIVLLISVAILPAVDFIQNKICIRDWILRQHLIIRWGIYLTAILSIWVFGTYGFGFAAQDFIYGGF